MTCKTPLAGCFFLPQPFSIEPSMKEDSPFATKSLTSGRRHRRLSGLPPSWLQLVPHTSHLHVTEHRDDRSPFALAYEWSARMTSISLELVAPTLIGYWLDQRLHSLPLFLILGVTLGFVTATLSLLRLTKPKQK